MNYFAVTSRPMLKKKPDGHVAVAGGEADVPVPAGANVPKLSDRPQGMPTPH
jgi:hypothetical protein